MLKNEEGKAKQRQRDIKTTTMKNENIVKNKITWNKLVGKTRGLGF